MATKAPAKATVTTRTRTLVDLPTSISSSAEDVVWPGSSRGGGQRNAALREQLAAEIQGMEFGSVRRYDIGQDDDGGSKAQDAFATLFRSVLENVHPGRYGVQVAKQASCLFVKLGNKQSRK